MLNFYAQRHRCHPEAQPCFWRELAILSRRVLVPYLIRHFVTFPSWTTDPHCPGSQHQRCLRHRPFCVSMDATLEPFAIPRCPRGARLASAPTRAPGTIAPRSVDEQSTVVGFRTSDPVSSESISCLESCSPPMTRMPLRASKSSGDRSSSGSLHAKLSVTVPSARSTRCEFVPRRQDPM
jgi:hypothetical protein